MGQPYLAYAAESNNRGRTCFKQNRRHLRVSSDLYTRVVSAPPPPEFLSVKQLRQTSPFLNIKGHRQCPEPTNACISGYKVATCFAPNGKLSDENSEDAKRFVCVSGGRITSYLLPSSKYPGAPSVGEELFPRQFSLEEQICTMPYMTDVLHFFSRHN